jgi:hypothetical protein
MVKNRHKCNNTVLKHSRFIHCKCNKYGHAIKTGSFLNRYLPTKKVDDEDSTSYGFETKMNYQVCKGMSIPFESSKIL